MLSLVGLLSGLLALRFGRPKAGGKENEIVPILLKTNPLTNTDKSYIIHTDMLNLLTRKNLAQQLEVSERTIHRYEKLGMPVTKIGGLRRYNEEEVKRWIAEINNLTK